MNETIPKALYTWAVHPYLRPIVGAAVGSGVALAVAYLNTFQQATAQERAAGWNRWAAALWQDESGMDVTPQEALRIWASVGAALGAGYELARALPLPAAARGAACGAAAWLAIEAAIRRAPGYEPRRWRRGKSARGLATFASHGAVTAWLTSSLT